MKIRESMKICNTFEHVFCAGAAELQYIMTGTDPTYYNAGLYGWNNDMYVDYANDIIITTGYRNLRGSRIPSEIIADFSARAQAILRDALPFNGENSAAAMLDENRKAFFRAILAEEKR